MTSQLDGAYTLLPLLMPVGEVPLESNDVLIHAPGFEDRTLAICDVLKPVQGSAVILLDYEPFNSNNRMHAVRRGLSDIGLSAENQSLLTYTNGH